jgi:hypothetical protein
VCTAALELPAFVAKFRPSLASRLRFSLEETPVSGKTTIIRGFACHEMNPWSRASLVEQREREKSVVWQKVLNSLWSEGKTHKTIADEIHVGASEVNDLLFGVLTAATGQTRQNCQPLTLVPSAENE